MKHLMPKLVIGMMMLALLVTGIHLPQVSHAATETRSGSFTTDRGTMVSINSSLTHEGGDTVPVLLTNKQYNLSITIRLDKLGNGTQNIHDLEFELSISTDSILGSGKALFNSYYFDAKTEMTQAGQSRTYALPILVTGNFTETSTTLKVVFNMKEAVDNRPDPTTKFDNIGYDLKIKPGMDLSNLKFHGNSSDSRPQEVYTNQGSKVSIGANLTHDGFVNNKPTMMSGKLYHLTVNITLLELGADVKDIHDLEVQVSMEDTSITNLLPGSSAVKYFSGYAYNQAPLNVSDSRVFTFAVEPNTNLNDTQVNLKFSFSFKENIPKSFDKTSTYPLNYEIYLNKGLSNLGFDSSAAKTPFPIYSGFLALLVAIPLIKKRRQS